MEYLSGGELWSLIKDDSNNQTNQVGCYWSLIPFIFAEAINGLEYMHRRGIVHRDIKPENILLTADGHIKYVDFGTAKDLFQTDLNGPEFVGTPEYMSPSTLSSKKGRGVGPEADLWSLGVVLYQLYLGVTAFHAASPYLIFLKVKRCFLRLPPFLPEGVKDMLKLLLEKDDEKRLENACKVEDKKGPISYDTLRRHHFFTECGQPDFATVDGIKEVNNRSAVRVPSLKDICIRAVGLACIDIADKVATNGGYKPDIPWIQRFDISKLDPNDQSRVAHFLNCKHKLHIPGIYRLFWNSVVDAKSIRVDSHTRDYIGFNRALQGQWHKDFFFAYLSGPELIQDDNNTSLEVENLRKAISSINKLRPRFLVASGNFTNTSPDDPNYESQLINFRKNMARVSESIAILYVAGGKDVASGLPSLLSYRKYFGADFYGFWYGGLRCLIINSSLFNENLGSDLVNEADGQDIWLEEEIEQAKLCSQHMIIFMHTPWFVQHIDEEYQEGVNISHKYRTKWLSKLRHTKVKYIFASGLNQVSKLSAFAHETKDKTTNGNNNNNVDNTTNDIITDGMKPSDIIAQAKESGEIESDEESDEENTNGEEEFLNDDPEYFGPDIISTPYISNKVEGNSLPGIRIVVVKEDDISQKFYPITNLPETSPIPLSI
jgi:3-phosphoinositide dependent protein kinase-1